MFFKKLKSFFIRSLNRVKAYFMSVHCKILDHVFIIQDAIRNTWYFCLDCFTFIRVIPGMILCLGFFSDILTQIEQSEVFDFFKCLGLLLYFLFIVAFVFISAYPIKTLLYFISVTLEIIGEYMVS